MEQKITKKSLSMTPRHSLAWSAKNHGGGIALVTAKSLARYVGTTVRTIQYYDRIGLFPPTDRTENGYRLYDEAAAERLQEILFYRELGFSLKEIEALISASPDEWNRLMDAQTEKLLQSIRECGGRLATIQTLRQKGPASVTATIIAEKNKKETSPCIAETAEPN